MENTKKQEEQEIEGLEVDTLSAEERGKIQEEIDAIFLQSSLAKSDDNRFNVSSYPKGMKVPLMLNALLFSVFVLIGIGAFFYINARTKKTQQESFNIQTEASVLTQEIIGQNKQVLDEKNQELDDIQYRLNSLLGNQGEIVASYEKKIAAYEQQLRSDIESKAEALRKQLTADEVSASEINRRVAELKDKLEMEYDDKLKTYTAEQDKLLLAQKNSFSQEINQLQSEYNTKESDVQSLQNEIAQKKAQIESQRQRISSQLLAAQSTLEDIRNRETNKGVAFEQFRIYHENIVGLMKRNEFVEAKEAITLALENMEQSPYRNDVETKTYRDAYATYGVMIDSVISAKKVLDKSSSNIKKLNQEKDNQTKDSNKINEELGDLEEKYAELKKEYNALKSNKTASNTAGVSAKANAVGKREGETKALENIKEIIGYLELKQGGVSDAASKKRIDNNIDATLYKNIINTLSDTMGVDY